MLSPRVLARAVLIGVLLANQSATPTNALLSRAIGLERLDRGMPIAGPAGAKGLADRGGDQGLAVGTGPSCARFPGPDIFAACNAALADLPERGKIVIPAGAYTGVATTLTLRRAGVTVECGGVDVAYSGPGAAVAITAAYVKVDCGMRLR